MNDRINVINTKFRKQIIKNFYFANKIVGPQIIVDLMISNFCTCDQIQRKVSCLVIGKILKNNLKLVLTILLLDYKIKRYSLKINIINSIRCILEENHIRQTKNYNNKNKRKK